MLSSPSHHCAVAAHVAFWEDSSQVYSYPEDIEIYGLFIKILIWSTVKSCES